MLDRDEQEISLILEESLEAIAAGEASVGDVLRKYPQMAAVLQPELEAALWLIAREQQVEPRAGFLSASKKRVVERIRQESRSNPFPGMASPRPRLAFRWAYVMLFLAVFAAGLAGLLSISQSALPGDSLYAVKRTSEQVVYSLAWSSVRQAGLQYEFTARRVEEIEALIEEGKYEAVEAAVRDFEQQASQAVTLLQQIDGKNLKEKGSLAGRMQEDFKEFAARLDALRLGAPADVRASLERARDASTSGASAASAVFEDVQEEIFSATDTPGREKPETVKTIQPKDSTRPPTGPDENSRPPTKTPKPANDNRPEKEPKPTKEPKPPKEDEATATAAPTVAEEPTDAPKPTKEDKPTKTDKPKDK